MSQHNRSPVRKLAVVGAGNMGSGIAQKMGSEGFEVVLVDVSREQVQKGLENIRKTLERGVERRIFKPEAAEAVRGRIHGTEDWDRLSDVELVIEAVFEDRAVKLDVFSRLDEVCRSDAILATNTSSLSVTELAAATRRPERVLGLHYFYHPAMNRLVEVVPGDKTAPDLVRKAWALQEEMGKTPIASRDRAGFVVNRYFVPWLNESVRLVEEGVADVATVEAAAKETFRIGMGPFELMNVTGVPIALHAASTLGEAFGALYAPAEELRRQVDSGAPWDTSGEPDRSRFPAVADRLLAVTFLVASQLVDEGVGTIEDTDIGARVGLRWPAGPFELMNRQGVDKAAVLAESLAQRWAVPTPTTLESHARSCRPFTFDVVRSSVQDAIATLTINRPDAMNALNEDVVAQLHEAFRQASEDPDVRGIVIAGAGKAFVAGADIRFFVQNMESGDLKRIVEFTRAGHALLNDIDRCPKPVVARLHGLALGGGLELALACDAIVATPRAAMAFPETGIGIYPGLGGTQRPTRKIGVGLTKWLVLTGRTLSAEEAEAAGLADRVVPHEALDEAVREAIDRGPGPHPRRAPLPDELRAVEALFERHSVEDLREGGVDPPSEPLASKSIRALERKAPVALRLAERLIVEGADRSLEEGLQKELDHLVEIFSTRDAYHGLSSLGREAPRFEGR